MCVLWAVICKVAPYLLDGLSLHYVDWLFTQYPFYDHVVGCIWLCSSKLTCLRYFLQNEAMDLLSALLRYFPACLRQQSNNVCSLSNIWLILALHLLERAWLSECWGVHWTTQYPSRIPSSSRTNWSTKLYFWDPWDRAWNLGKVIQNRYSLSIPFDWNIQLLLFQRNKLLTLVMWTKFYMDYFK